VGPPGMGPRAFPGIMGLVQRLQLMPFFVWIALVVRRAYRESDAGASNAVRGNDASRAVPT